MRDRLSYLQELSNGHVEQMEYAESSAASDSFSNVDLEEDLCHEAVVFDNSEELEVVFGQSQEIHREVQLIRLEIKRLREQNSRVLHGTTRMSTIKRDANAIGTDIKRRAEGVLQQLRDMDYEAGKLEEEYGVNAARGTHRPHAVRLPQQRLPRRHVRLQRGGDEPPGELQGAHPEADGDRGAGGDERGGGGDDRDGPVEHLQRRPLGGGQDGEVGPDPDREAPPGAGGPGVPHQEHPRDLLGHVALLVEEQGPMLTSIQSNIQKTDEHIQEALVKLGTAKRHDKNNPFKKMFCSCFPCYQ